MTTQPFGGALFIADALGLDFLNSVSTTGHGRVVDHLKDGAGLSSWLSQAGLGPGPALAERWLASTPRELDRVAAEARRLREWFREFVFAHMGCAVNAAHLSELVQLNAILERQGKYHRIVAADTARAPLEMKTLTFWSSPDSLLVAIAEALAQVVCEVDFTRIRACEGPDCGLLFVDHSRGPGRRWCRMTVCGNRSKQASWRGRSRPGRPR
jgi:predicted RNA-binding Zn ribbon-like protein